MDSGEDSMTFPASPSPSSEDRTTMRAYLLGTLAEKEREQVEQNLFGSSEYYERLLDVENDLFDAYASGQLSAADRARFERTLLASKSQREKLNFSRAVAASGYRRPIAWPVYGAIAAGIAAAVLSWALLRQNFELRRQIASAPHVTISSPRGMPPVQSIVLAGAQTRGAERNVIRIDPKVALVHFQVVLAGATPGELVRGTLSASNAPTLDLGSARVTTESGFNVAEFWVPAAMMPATASEVKVTSHAGVDTFPIRIER